MQGAAGRDGTNGQDGATGPRGQEGPTGPTGPAGAAGLRGPQGLQGQAGAMGARGSDGAAGAKGDKGDTGEGVPTGGTAGQHLAKIDGTDYNTQWVNAPSGGGGGFTLPTVTVEQMVANHLTIATGRTNAVYPSTWTEIYRKTHSATATTFYTIQASLTFDVDYTPLGGGERAEADVRVRHFNSSNVMQNELVSQVYIYVRNVPQLNRVGSAAIAVSSVLANGDYILFEAQGRLQNVGTGSPLRNVRFENVSRAIITTQA